MASAYSDGNYLVFGYGPDAERIGRVDHDAFVRSEAGELLFRIEDTQVFDMDDNYLADIEDGTAITPEGERLFVIQAE